MTYEHLQDLFFIAFGAFAVLCNRQLVEIGTAQQTAIHRRLGVPYHVGPRGMMFGRFMFVFIGLVFVAVGCAALLGFVEWRK